MLVLRVVELAALPKSLYGKHYFTPTLLRSPCGQMRVHQRRRAKVDQSGLIKIVESDNMKYVMHVKYSTFHRQFFTIAS